MTDHDNPGGRHGHDKGAFEKAFDTVGQTVGKTVGYTVGTVGKLLDESLKVPGMLLPDISRQLFRPGGRPGLEGIEELEAAGGADASVDVCIECIDFGPDRHERTPVEDLAGFLAKGQPDWATVRWLNIDGLSASVVRRIMDAYDLHTLAAEDVINVPQRPKVDVFDDHLFIVVRQMMLREGRLHTEQLSMFLKEGLLITFQETHGDMWDPVRERVFAESSRIRQRREGYLAYTLLDALVDHVLPVIETFGERIETIEDEVVTNPNSQTQWRIHTIKRELAVVRRLFWPMREVVHNLAGDEDLPLRPETRTYLRDVLDHCVQVIEVVDTYHDMAAGVSDLYNSVISNRMNEVMKVLTIMASLFIPLGFLAGVYGMNFEHIPELGWKYGYFMFWAIAATVITGLLTYFRRKKWL